MGVFKERLSQSALYAEMLTTPDAEARAVYEWLLNKGMNFKYGKNPETDLTEAQSWNSAKCISQPCVSPMPSAATRWASNINRV